jgi:hypothetical protein
MPSAMAPSLPADERYELAGARGSKPHGSHTMTDTFYHHSDTGRRSAEPHTILSVLFLATFCGLLLAAAVLLARAEVVHDRAANAPPTLAQAAEMNRAASNPKLSPTERAHLHAKATSAARSAAANPSGTNEATVADTLTAVPGFLLPLALAGLPFAFAVGALRTGARGRATLLSVVSALTIVGCYLVVGVWWAQINEESVPNYVPPGTQYMSIAVLLYATDVLIGIVVFPIFTWFAQWRFSR